MNDSLITNVLMIIGMLIVTWGVRIAPFLTSNLNLSGPMLKVLNCVPAAVLAALVAETILDPIAQTGSIIQPELIAAIICLGLGVSGVPMLVTVLIGMLSFWLLRLVI